MTEERVPQGTRSGGASDLLAELVGLLPARTVARPVDQHAFIGLGHDAAIKRSMLPLLKRLTRAPVVNRGVSMSNRDLRKFSMAFLAQ
ncbi:hypothetical protein Y695_02234 [Hydrogenophaga sp. T4]|nr:hypothetical protein Y695_02234 [Hydrogenophaga sp. T4]